MIIITFQGIICACLIFTNILSEASVLEVQDFGKTLLTQENSINMKNLYLLTHVISAGSGIFTFDLSSSVFLHTYQFESF